MAWKGGKLYVFDAFFLDGTYHDLCFWMALIICKLQPIGNKIVVYFKKSNSRVLRPKPITATLLRGGKRYDFQIERGGNPNLAWIGAMNLKILLCFFTQIYQLRYPKREWNICLFIL